MIYRFQTSDGDIIEMREEILNLSSVLREMIQISINSENEPPVLIEKVSTRTFNKILEWGELYLKSIKMKQYLKQEDPKMTPFDVHRAYATKNIVPYRLDDWEELFLEIDNTTLHDLIMASNYLHIQPLMDICCKYIASKISGKTPQQLRQMFNIQSDYTPEEEQKIMDEYRYCDDPTF